ncbi:hypothetical protein [Zoogloea sp.]|uniref:hypothetical protein n=1 Tax=Zoogloea sp. TaxID=49181 RepID=UPI0035B0152F
MVKIVWNVVEVTAHRASQRSNLEPDLGGLIGRLGCDGVQGLVFDFGNVERSVALWTKFLSEIGLRVCLAREISSGWQIKLACGIVLSFYTTGTLMAQGRYTRDQVVAVKVLRSLLDSIKVFCTSGSVSKDYACTDEQF